MRHEEQTEKAFYVHAETSEILVIERRWDGVIIGSCPATEPFRDADSYDCTPDNNVWLAEQSDKLLLMDSQVRK